MNISNKKFILSETLFGAWVVSHTVTETLQIILLIVSICAGCIGIYQSLKNLKK